LPRSEALFSSAGVPPAADAPTPVLVDERSSPLVDPPAAMLDELSAPAPAADPPVPIAVDVLPFPAVAPPTPNVDAEPVPLGP